MRAARTASLRSGGVVTTTYAAAMPAASIRTLVTVRAVADVTSDQPRDPPEPLPCEPPECEPPLLREPVDEPYAEPPLPRMVSEPPDADEVDAPLIPLVASRT